MGVSVTLELQGEAHGAVGPLRGALTHASGWGLRSNARLAERHRRRGSLPLPHTNFSDSVWRVIILRPAKSWQNGQALWGY
jgi:hypothetical protein